MGRVYAVFDRELERPLAMKVLPAGAAAATQRRFLVEAKLTGGLEHPGIVAVHELGHSPAGLWFTMARVRGETFEALIPRARAQRDGWNLARATQVLLRVCEAVGFAHSRGVVHRDLKPANVMVGAFGETYVMDWGLAQAGAEARASGESSTTPEQPGSPSVARHRPDALRGIASNSAAGQVSALSAASPAGDSTAKKTAVTRSVTPGLDDLLGAGLTRLGDVVGTPAYMAPEQARGESRSSGISWDVYAVGAMLYQLLAGHPPHQDEGQDSSPRAVLSRAAHSQPTPLERLAPRAPAELIAIAARAMAPDPAERYRDVGALGEDLRAFLEGRVVRAYESGGLAELKKWIGRNRRFAAALAGLLLAIVLGTAATFEAKGRERARALRFYDLQLVREAQAEAEFELWPETPERVPDFRGWLTRAEQLLERAQQHRAELARLDSAAAAAAERPVRAADGSLLGYTFADPDQRWRHQRLQELVAELARFGGPEGAYPSVRARLDWAEQVLSQTITSRAADWSAAAERVARDARFRGLPLSPQLGLIPLGPDPLTGLEEFALARSGSLPTRKSAGELSYAPDSALVLVLLPGGDFELGQVDDLALSDETPRHQVSLAPFLIGKHELTQAQWRQLGGSASAYFSGAERERWPMESVTWSEADQLLRQHGLTLPSEAQWEFAALGGSPARFPWGDDPTPLFERAVLESEQPWPVGSLPPEHFGLHDLLGNLSEWCLDPLSNYSDPWSGPNALRTPSAPLAERRHMVRGGYHSAGLSPEQRDLATRLARPRTRLAPPAEQRSEHRGLRPARQLGP
jgi:formylglycine-generating enzyme required for sulfatase activity/serine/threonine protein kinase